MPILKGDDQIRKVLMECKTIAVLGASPDPFKPSFFVSLVVRSYGFKMYYVNPSYQDKEILGDVVYGSLTEIPDDIDIVDVFRRPSVACEVARNVKEKGCKTVWFQPGTEDLLVVDALSSEEYNVVVGKCMKVECRRLI